MPALYGSLALLAIAVGLLVASNMTVIITFGFGVSTTDITVWRTCEALTTGGERCYAVTSNSQCTELSSRMKAIGAFSILATASSIMAGVLFLFESRGVTFPVTHLTKIIVGWMLIFTIVCIGVAIGTLVAKLCSDPLPMKDRNGSFGPAFYTLFGALFVQLVSAALYAFFRVKQASDPDPEDQNEQKDISLADL